MEQERWWQKGICIVFVVFQKLGEDEIMWMCSGERICYFSQSTCKRNLESTSSSPSEITKTWDLSGVEKYRDKRNRVSGHTHKYCLDSCFLKKKYGVLFRGNIGCHHTSVGSKYIFNSGKDY